MQVERPGGDPGVLPFSQSPCSHHTVVVRTSHLAPKPTCSIVFVDF